VVCSLRDGTLVELLGRYLVPGDVVQLNTGDRVPADLRLMEVGVVRLMAGCNHYRNEVVGGF